MSIQLLKVTNATIRVTESVTFPIIKAVIQTDGSATATEMNNLFDEIYSRSIGMVSLCSMWAYQEEPSDLQGDAIGDRTWGDDNGFKIRVNIQGRQGYGSNWSTTVSPSTVWYKGIIVCAIYALTGYSHWENDCGIIFVDSDNRIYTLKTQWGAFYGLCMLGSTNPGYTIRPGYIVASVVNSGVPLRPMGDNTTFTLLENITNDIVGEIDPDVTDPYAPGGNTGTGGGNGDFDDTSDPIDFPSLPSLGATDTGLVTLYNPSLSEIRALASYMWTNPAFDISAWKKIFADPIDAILGLSIVPVAVPDGGQRHIAVGNLFTDVVMNVAAQQYIEVQCGALNVNEFWSSYLDYDPYTKAEIYLPYCGTHQLSVDDIMNKTVEVRYHVDILSGSCCAYVKCGDSVLYQFIGQCASSIPVASGDFSEIVSSAINAALAVGSVIATGGASAPFALPSYTANAVNILKEKIQKSGSISGTGGMLAIQKPYLILTRPRQAVPANQNHYTGYPSFITENLSELAGYTEIEEIHLENVPATDSELNEIVTLLEGGVIF